MTAWTLSCFRNGALVVALGLIACAPQVPLGMEGSPCSATKKCSAGLVCTNGTCQEDKKLVSACTAGQKRCEGSDVEVCKADSSGWDTATSCAAGCDAKTAACNTQICDPTDPANAVQCQGDEVLACNDDGTAWDPKEKCQNGCRDNKCIAGVCRPNQQKCLPDGTIEACQPDGSAWGTPQVCDGHCVDNQEPGAAETANCLKTSCTPDALRCDGLTLVKCAADGSAETPVTNCAYQCTTVAGVAQCTDASCQPTSTRCSTDGKSVERCNPLGTGWDTTTCDLTGDGAGSCLLTRGTGGTGSAARCISPICTPSQVRCVSDRLLTCSSNGLEQTQAACAYGCTADGTACAQPACATNQYQCDPSNPTSVLQVCGNDRRSFVFDQYCAGGCVSDANTGARCGFTVCSPLVARCTSDGQLQTCSADGKGWDTPQPCSTDGSEVCLDNACVPPPAVCNDGETRCNGQDLERCIATTGKPSGFAKIGACLGTCQADSCDAAGECGAIHLSLPLVTPGDSLPADGQSTFLVLSDPLLGPSGLPLPEGTLVTVAVDSPDGGPLPRLLSGDADPSTPGLQVLVVDDRIDFLVGAPSGNGAPSTAEIKAQVGDHAPCSGSLTVTFDPAVNDRYVSEDFSTTRMRDGSGPVTQWDTRKGVLTLNAFDAGNGSDGDLDVPPGSTVDLSTRVQPGRSFADMASAPVREVKGDLVAIDADPAPFSAPGTRVLLINLQGSLGRASSAGAWEMATVAGVSGGFVKLTAPATRTYGEGGNTEDALAGQSVRLIRVPQYRKLTVEGTLTGPPVTDTPDGIAGGVLVFLASGRSDDGTGPSVISGAGTITMTGMGYRGAQKPPDVALDSPSSCGTSEITSDHWHVKGIVGAGANDYSGEGIEGLRDSDTSVGTTAAGGGYECGDGNVRPFKSGLPYTYANQTDQLFFGTSGSYATQGRDSCSYLGSGTVYGDALLGHLYPGGGSGSVSMSEANDCADASHGCARINGSTANDCCGSGTGTYAGDGVTSTNPGPQTTYETGNPPPANNPHNWVACNQASGECNTQCQTATWVNYCDAQSTLWKQSYPGAPGGGIIIASIADLQMAGSSNVQADGVWSGYCNVGTDQSGQYGSSTFCYGGAGGSIYLRSENLDLGGATARLQATGGTSGSLPGGGDGRIRIDDVKLLNAMANGSYATPQATSVALDGDTVSSLPEMSLPAGVKFQTAAAVLFPVGTAIALNADGTVNVSAAIAASQLTLGLSADGATTYGAVGSDGTLLFNAPPNGPPLPQQGGTAQWRMSPALGKASGETRGFAVKYTIQ